MFLHRFAGQPVFQFAVALVVAASWLQGCGDDSENSGKGGSGGTAGSAGSATGGTAGSTGGSVTGGTGGAPTGGSGGALTGGSGGAAGSAGSAGSAGTGGAGMGGEGGASDGGEGGMGQGGEGGSPDSMCTNITLGLTHVSAAPAQQHDHLPVTGVARMTLVNMINNGTPLVFTLPEDGQNSHDHTLTFTALQLGVLRNGGALAMNVTSSMGGPQGNQHTHTYAIECQP